MNFSRIKRLKTLFFILPLLFALSGCIYLVIGTVGAMGGYVISPDTVEGMVNHHDETVWELAVQTLGIMGIIEEQQQAAGIIIAKVNNAKVTVTISTISRKTTKLTVKARRSFFPKIQLAQDIYAKIAVQLDE
jgi:hypothetical protein